jgi:hypothetical protein
VAHARTAWHRPITRAPQSKLVTNDLPFTEDQILAVALRFAADAGEARPSLIQHAVGPYDHAVEVGSFGNRVPANSSACFVVAVRGSFVLHNAHSPAGVAAPRGTVLVLYIDAETGACIGRGLGDRYPDLEELGQVTTDLTR